MLTKLKARLGGLGIGLLAAAVVAVGVVAVPATAQPVATASQGIVKQVRLALKFGQVANKKAGIAIRRSGQAIQLARQGGAGAVGPQGPQGEKGDKGDRGSRGSEGPTGPTGPDGDNGSNGADGKTVLSGSGVPSDGLGVDGDFYMDTSPSTMY